MQARKPTLITEGKCRLHQPEDKHGYLHSKDMRRTHITYGRYIWAHRHPNTKQINAYTIEKQIKYIIWSLQVYNEIYFFVIWYIFSVILHLMAQVLVLLYAQLVNVSALLWFIRYICYWNLQFLNNVIIIYTKVFLPHA
jgi:hypothetical protein